MATLCEVDCVLHVLPIAGEAVASMGRAGRGNRAQRTTADRRFLHGLAAGQELMGMAKAVYRR